MVVPARVSFEAVDITGHVPVAEIRLARDVQNSNGMRVRAHVQAPRLALMFIELALFDLALRTIHSICQDQRTRRNSRGGRQNSALWQLIVLVIV